MPSTRHRNERDDGAGGKKQPNQRAGQNSDCAKGGGAPISHARIETSRPGAQKQVENPFKRQRINRFRDHVPRKNEHPNACGHGQSAIKPGSSAKESSAKFERQQDKSHHGQAHGEPGGKFVFAKQFVAGGHQPEVQGGTNQVAHAIHVHDHKVVSLQHFLRHQGVSGVNVFVVQRRRPGSTDIEARG